MHSYQSCSGNCIDCTGFMYVYVYYFEVTVLTMNEKISVCGRVSKSAVTHPTLRGSLDGLRDVITSCLNVAAEATQLKVSPSLSNNICLFFKLMINEKSVAVLLNGIRYLWNFAFLDFAGDGK